MLIGFTMERIERLGDPADMVNDLFGKYVA